MEIELFFVVSIIISFLSGSIGTYMILDITGKLKDEVRGELNYGKENKL